MTHLEHLDSQDVTRSLTRRSLAAVGILATLAVGSLLLFLLQTRTLEAGAGVLNTSGRQRMLSQRAALLAQRLSDEPDPALRTPLRDELLRVADELEQAHLGLMNGDAELGLPGSPGSTVMEVFQSSPHELDRQLRAYLDDLRGLAAESAVPNRRRAREIAESAGPDNLLGALDAAVDAFQEQEESKIAWLKRAQIAVLLLTLVAIELMRRRIIVPMVSRVGGHIDELRLREDNIKRSQEELRSILENAPIGIATCDLHGRFLRVNQALCTLLDAREQELIGRTFLDFTHPDDVASSSLWLQKSSRGEVGAYRLDQRLVLQDGAVLRGVLHSAVVERNSQEPSVLIAQFEDHTELLEAQEAVRLNHERMAHVSRLSTMGEMAAGIAHEVNQPLSAITLYSDACKRLIHAGKIGTQQHLDSLNKIGDQAHRAGEVIRRIRSLGEQSDMEYQRHDLNEVVRKSLDLAGTYAGFHDFRLRVVYGEDLPAVAVDEVQVQQVILNLINNAVEAQLQEKNDDAILITTGAADDGTLEVTVTDTGGGLADGLEDHLFEPFFSTKEGGMGIGLSISRTIIDDHGGSLGFRPNRDVGSVFYFRLPAAQVTAQVSPG